MTSRWRVGALLVALAVLGACSGGGDDDAQNASSQSSNKTSTTPRLGSDNTTPSGVSGSAGSTTTLKGAMTTTGKPGSTATPPGGGGAPATTAAPGESMPPAAANGTYTYSQSGSGPDGPVPSTGTLVVSNPSYSRYYDQSKKPQTLTYVFNSDGAFITRAVLNVRGFTVTCNFSNPLAAPAWPPTAGRTDSANGSCSLGLSATATSRINSRSGDIISMTVSVHAYNADRSVDVTATDVTGWSISLRVPKTSTQTFSGTAAGNPVSGEVRSTLTAHP